MHRQGITFIDIDVNANCFEQGFAYYELILRTCYLEFGLVVKSLILANAFIEEN